MGGRWSKVIIALSLVGLLGFGIWRFGQNPTQSVSLQTPARAPKQAESDLPINKSEAAPAKTEWPFWGGAFCSASVDGTAFFDHRRAFEFAQTADPRLRAYVIELSTRALLPVAFVPAKSEISEIMPDVAPGQTGLALIQFLSAPTDAERAKLAAAGIELIAYMSGRAWSARGTTDAFAAAGAMPFVRGLSRLDPRDKMHEQVYRGDQPAYALDAEGRTRYMLVTIPGTTTDGLKTLFPNAAEIVVSKIKSALGPVFDLKGQTTLAQELAKSDATAYIELAPPPAAVRDAVTDRESNITQVRDQNEKLDGSNITVAQRELTRPTAHVDFASRLTYIDTLDLADTNSGNHATEVLGVIASNGVAIPGAKGVAPNVKVLFYSLEDGDFAVGDIGDAQARGARISNHSYGPSGSFGAFGDYRTVSQDWDNEQRARDHLGIFAGFEDQTAAYIHEDFFVGNKNGICVGATDGRANAGPPPSDGIAYFSNFGPMQDGRIKPDLVAYGKDVLMDIGTNGSTTNQGTSFATPAVTGIAVLLSQQYLTTSGKPISAALLKALLCESATDLGQPGPDAVYGFGIANARAGVSLIELSGAGASPFVEGTVNSGIDQKFEVTVPVGLPFLKATLCWMDIGGTPGAAKALVNDLDLVLTDPTGFVHFPYSLSASNPSANATNTGPNTVDPIEQTFIANPIPGRWTVTVSGANVMIGPQQFSFCSNVPLSRPLVASFIASPTSGAAPLDVLFNATGSSGDIQSYFWDFGDGATAQGIQVSHTYTTLGEFTATLTITDSNLDTRKTQMVISVSKNAVTVFPYQALGKIDFLKAERNALNFAVIVPDLVRTPQQARDAVLDGEFEGKHYLVRVLWNDDPQQGNTDRFLVDRRIMEVGKTESFKVDLRKGAIYVKLKQHEIEPRHDLKSLYSHLGIDTNTPSPSTIHMRVEIESETATDTLYRADFTLEYKGKNGKGTLKLLK